MFRPTRPSDYGWATFDDPKETRVRRYEQDSYVPLVRMDQTKGTTEPQLYYFHCNASGQPEELTDANGNILWHARYATWGKLVFESTTSYAPFGFEQNLRMQGQYDDRITGLYYNTFRYYDPDIGRFTTEDPIGLLGGTNLYQYAPNPLSWIDPWGWEEVFTSGQVYRMGSSTDANLTPRPGKDTTTGLSTTIEKPQGKFQTLDVKTLIENDLEVVKDGKNHASVRPVDDPDRTKLKEWANTRGTSKQHKFTQAVRSACQ